MAGGKLVSKLGNNLGSHYARNSIGFQNPGGINKIACTITVVGLKTDTGTNPVSFARIGGYFYNVQNSGGQTGDIWAEIQIGDRGSGLEAFYEVEKTLNDENTDWEIIGSGTLIPPGTLQTGTPYPVELEYTNAHDIIFRVAGQSATFSNAGRQRPPVSLFKHLATGIGTGRDADDGSGMGYVSALFDDIFINDQAQAYDRFSSGLINTAKWIQQEYVREISNGKLHLNIKGSGAQVTTQIDPVVKTDYLQAKVLIENGSWMNQTGGHARLIFIPYNVSRGPGSGQDYNDLLGHVWVTNRIFMDENRDLWASASVWRFDDPDNGNIGTSLFWQDFSTPINFDTEYILSIEYTGSKINFKCNNETITYDVPTPVYPSFYDTRSIRSRVYSGGSGYIKTQIDDVYVYAPGIGPSVNILLFEEP